MTSLRLPGCCTLCEDSRSCGAFTCYGKLALFPDGHCSFELETYFLCLSLHSSDSEGTFGTPEAESPGVEKMLAKLDNSSHTGEEVQVSGSPPTTASSWKPFPKAIYVIFLNPTTKGMTKPLQTATFFCSNGFLMMIFSQQSAVRHSVLGHTGTGTIIFHACEFTSRPQCHSLSAFFYQFSSPQCISMCIKYH